MYVLLTTGFQYDTMTKTQPMSIQIGNNQTRMDNVWSEALLIALLPSSSTNSYERYTNQELEEPVGRKAIVWWIIQNTMHMVDLMCRILSKSFQQLLCASVGNLRRTSFSMKRKALPIFRPHLR